MSCQILRHIGDHRALGGITGHPLRHRVAVRHPHSKRAGWISVLRLYHPGNTATADANAWRGAWVADSVPGVAVDLRGTVADHLQAPMVAPGAARGRGVARTGPVALVALVP
jgi:hypothetical protein